MRNVYILCALIFLCAGQSLAQPSLAGVQLVSYLGGEGPDMGHGVDFDSLDDMWVRGNVTEAGIPFHLDVEEDNQGRSELWPGLDAHHVCRSAAGPALQ